MDFDKSLNKVCVQMLIQPESVLYGLFLAELNKSFDSKFPTACIAKYPNSSLIQMVFGETFWEKTCTSDEMRIGIIKHELEHVIREHVLEDSRLLYPDKMLGNIAMDISINQVINEPLPTQDHEGNKIGAFLSDYPGFTANESSLYYYRKLSEMKEEKQKSKGTKDSKAPGQPKGNKRGTSGNSTLDSYLDAEEDGKMDDWHKSWDEITKGMNEAQKDMLRRDIQEQLKRVTEETQRMKGDVPAHIQNALDTNFGRKKPTVPWQVLFRRFIGTTIDTKVKQHRKRPNFRFEDAPVNKYIQKVSIVVGMDSSGSVSDHELAAFFGETKHMWKNGAKVHIAIWDAAVHKTYEYKGEDVYERVCQGGTHASSFIEYVNENQSKNKWCCAINLTDGYIESNPSPCRIPMLWLITPSGSLDFNHKGKKIKMNE